MGFQSVYHDVKVVPQVMKDADNETLVGSGVDTAGYEGVAFVTYALKGEAAEFAVTVYQDEASNYATEAALVGSESKFSTAIATDAHNVVDVYQPADRYVRPKIVVPNLVAATPVACIALLYKGRVAPVANVGTFLQSPDEV